MADQNEVAEAAKNCAGCKKSISRAKRYYRNGAYYCNKNCFQKKMAALAAKAAESGEQGRTYPIMQLGASLVISF